MSATALSQELSKTEKLNGTNFALWKRRIGRILDEENVDYVLDKSIPTKPVDDDSLTVIREYQKWEKYNRNVRNCLLTFMEPDIEVVFEEYNNAKDMFEAIKETYGKITETYVQLLIEKYYGCEMREEDSVIDHVSKMNMIAKELAVTRNPIPEKIQVSTILNSLPSSWNSIVTTLNLSGREVSIKNLPTLLGLEVERKRKKSQPSSLMVITKPTETSQVAEKRGLLLLPLLQTPIRIFHIEISDQR
ncbi:PREDICTED: uncharacterized protein LOC104612672 [Nelumbo nucifera]|uniref:Uncharacterized protein LOC104612672 n=1 Tax=Nelumbo nucifera TaxID=4432 RepID=A0A1U8BAY2_NELNU|nr:PREDICTED: uncharacterized protein LOC104612672 [Nelumbo nucifera]